MVNSCKVISNVSRFARNLIMHINPDHFLQTKSGRVITPARNAAAWAKCFDLLSEALQNASPSTKVYLLIGPQGCGKSTWARARNLSPENSIIFDAILVKRAERKPILAAVGAHSIQAVAVWFKTPIEVCISRNASRPSDEFVPEQAIRNVHRAIEPPSIAEGFVQVIEVPYVPVA